VTEVPKWGMVIDLFRCIGCHGCTYSCKAENNTGRGVFWARVFDYEVGKYPRVTRSFLPMPCMMCEDAPCEQACPSGATYRRKDGIVAVDADKCVGCKTCMLACPYDARFMNSEEVYFDPAESPRDRLRASLRQPGAVEKCTFCKERIDRGLAQGLTPGSDWDATPACVNACPANARVFGDLQDPDSEISRLIATHSAEPLRRELSTRPSVYYISASKPIQRGEVG